MQGKWQLEYKDTEGEVADVAWEELVCTPNAAHGARLRFLENQWQQLMRAVKMCVRWTRELDLRL